MRNVYVCSPLRGNITENLAKVRQYGKFVLECGMAPVIPHFYAEILDDTVDEERALGMTAGTSLLFRADELWVFGDKITEGMKKEITFAEHLKLVIRKISDKDLEIGGKKYAKKYGKKKKIRGCFLR